MASKNRGAYLYRRERKNRTHRLADRLSGTGIESRRRARSGGSRATSGTTSEDGSSGQQDDYDTEVPSTISNNHSHNKYICLNILF